MTCALIARSTPKFGHQPTGLICVLWNVPIAASKAYRDMTTAYSGGSIIPQKGRVVKCEREYVRNDMPTPIRLDGDEPLRGWLESSSGSSATDSPTGMPRLNRFPGGAFESLTMSSSFSYQPSHTVHVRLDNGSEFTREDIRRWAEGQLCGIAMGEEDQVIKALSRIVIQAL